MLLKLKPRSFFSIGIDFDVGNIKFVLIDILSEVVSQKRLKIQKNIKIPDFIQLLVDNIKKIIAENNINDKYLLGIGISVPGIINSESGEIIILHPTWNGQTSISKPVLMKY